MVLSGSPRPSGNTYQVLEECKSIIEDEGKAGLILTTISREIGIANRDYLRQIIIYERPNSWEKENFRLVEEFRGIVEELI